MLEKKIYSSYAFSEGEHEKLAINREIYKELTEKYRIYHKEKWYDLPAKSKEDNMSEILESHDLVYTREAGYEHAIYRVLKKPENITDDELMLIFDGGNLCFGGSKISNNTYRISED